MQILKFLTSLEQKGMKFIAQHPDGDGSQELFFSAEELISFESKPEKAIAQKYGATQSDYLNWIDQGFSVQCSAKTQSGSRCKNIVPDGNRVSLETWVELTGKYCDIHESGLSKT